MNLTDVLASQYGAALAMLRQAVTDCPDDLWDAPLRNRFGQIAYHALFYAHLYSQPSEADFRPWSGHRPGFDEFDPAFEQPYTKAEVLSYLNFVEAEIQRQLATLDPDAPSGFHWLPMTKLELQLYNIRHIQLHVGDLAERLGSQAGIDVKWVGRRHNPA
jgi:hypothetical protein